MRALRYYYYRIYTYYSKGDPNPSLKTFIVIFVGAFFNFLTLASAMSIILKIRFTFFAVEKGAGRLWPLLFLLPLYGLFTYYFRKLEYHGKIIREFSDETRIQKYRSGLFVILYFVTTIILFVVSLWIRQKANGY